MAQASAFFYKQTGGIRVTVQPTYIRDESRPWQQHHVFAYAVRIENVGALPAQLISRRWLIHDDIGDDREVEGEGVVGEQPIIQPGQVHEYRSFCVLKAARGYMEGEYRFVEADGTRFVAQIPRFTLSAELRTDLPS